MLRMIKINKNPIKIAKMAAKHRGMKRTEESKRNMSEASKRAFRTDPTLVVRRSGKGQVYIHNIATGERRRIWNDVAIPDGWKPGLGPHTKRDVSAYIAANINTVIAINPQTGRRKRFKREEDIFLPWVSSKAYTAEKNRIKYAEYYASRDARREARRKHKESSCQM